MKCELIMLLPEKGRVYALGEGSAVIGRDAGSDMQLLFENVSRRHAKLEVSAERCVVEDLGSSNGTMVNAKTISRHELHDGDEVKIGDCVLSFRVYEDKNGSKEYFVPRQYSDKSIYTTVKMKRASGFLSSFLRK